MEFWVYILHSSALNKYYIGHTQDLNARLKEHRLRKNLGASDWEIKHTEQFTSRSEAMKRELEIKKKKKRKYLESLINKGQ